ncbi:hypothetical protein OAO39_00685 [Pirellulaceae bacterium]|jgi:hypothetical protein|nr:hypothetical protein [Pirellulaceae bacterium]MDC0574424.1 hypothetical protein [Pirellulaceae bacterium]
MTNGLSVRKLTEQWLGGLPVAVRLGIGNKPFEDETAIVRPNAVAV